ncbi:MAG TPA: phosphotransferase [Rubrobacteraceae bacterium]|nr:phosphotransferase [Rubrobacteraceae bacterium]
METSDSDLKRVVEAMPEWSGAARMEAEYISGGITNRNYCVRVDGEPFFVRLAGEETEALGIDRANERAAVEAAAAVGVGPGVVAYLPEHGCLVTEWLEGREIPPEELRGREVLGGLVGSIRAFHNCPQIPGTFSPFRVVELYRESAERRGVKVPEVYWWLLERAREVEKALRQDPTPMCPCHNDLLNANFLLQDHRVMIVDYEYAGMGDVYFDLGNLSVNNDFDDATDLALLELYFGVATPPRVARLKLMRLMSDFREAMWGVMQQALSTLDFDYEDYANKHFERCCEHAGDERHATWLRDAAYKS